MRSWTALDHVRQKIQCEMCGTDYDATRQLMKEKQQFRRSGVLGKEANNLGAVPVILTLQQLDTNLMGGLTEHVYSTSLDLTPDVRGAPAEAEVDFVWMAIEGHSSGDTEIILGECKDRGKDPGDPRGGALSPRRISSASGKLPMRFQRTALTSISSFRSLHPSRRTRSPRRGHSTRSSRRASSCSRQTSLSPITSMTVSQVPSSSMRLEAPRNSLPPQRQWSTSRPNLVVKRRRPQNRTHSSRLRRKASNRRAAVLAFHVYIELTATWITLPWIPRVRM